MQLPKTFSQCLQDLMKTNLLTINKLGTQLGYKTELRRILKGESTFKKIEELYNRLQAQAIFSPEELERLKTALDVSEIGVMNYVSRSAIDQLLFHADGQGDNPLFLVNGGTFNDRIQFLKGFDSIEILCVNCCYCGLYRSLKPLFENRKLNLKMRHYIRLCTDHYNAAMLFNAVSPIVFDERYFLYKMENQHLPINASQGINGDVLTIRAQKGKKSCEYFFIMKNDSFAYEMPNEKCNGLFTFVASIVDDTTPDPLLVKENLDTTAPLGDLMMRMLGLELNRATYYLSTDLCHMQIPPAAIGRVYNLDRANPMNDKQSFSENLPFLHSRRHENFYNKHKTNYSIMSLERCRQFLETGNASNQLVSSQLYTKKERLEIFALMLKYAQSNPRFHPLLLAESSFMPKYHCACFDQLGLAVGKYDPFGHLTKDSPFILIRLPEFIHLFANYYKDYLITTHCKTKEESLTLLTALYNEYKEKYR